jgi:ABC-type thiamine transport system ATPase subunit
MTVEENLAFSLQLHKIPKQEQQKRVAEAARMLGLEPFLKRKPAALSGGQRQRVAMGRAIVREPQAFLMDEPLSNLDAKLRVSTRAQLQALHERLGVTTVYVTHDQQEASEGQDQAGGLVGEGEGLWTARVNPKSSVRPGRAVDLAVDPSALYWFDPDSGQAIPRQPARDRPSGTQQAIPLQTERSPWPSAST